MTCRIDSGSDNHFIDTIIITGIKHMKRDVGELDHLMRLYKFDPQPVYGVKSGVLSPRTLGNKKEPSAFGDEDGHYHPGNMAIPLLKST